MKNNAILLCLITIAGCLHGQPKRVTINLPEAAYPKISPSLYPLDELFTIQVNENDSISIFANNAAYNLHSLESLKEIFCQEVNTFCDRTGRIERMLINIEASPSTPFRKIDELVEAAKQVNGMNKILFRTKNQRSSWKGFVLFFPETQAETKPFVGQLYGMFLVPGWTCQIQRLQQSQGMSAPPPPPPLIPDSMKFRIPLDKIKAAVSSGDYKDLVLVGYENNTLMLNGKPVGMTDFEKMLQAPDVAQQFYIMLNQRNTYADFIQLIDVMHTDREHVYEAAAIRLYGEPYAALGDFEKFVLRDKYSIKWATVSLAEQAQMGLGNQN